MARGEIKIEHIRIAAARKNSDVAEFKHVAEKRSAQAQIAG
jgi:hypothetical protein